MMCVEECGRHGIPTAVIHIARFTEPPTISQIGLDRARRLVDLAERNQVNQAFENLNDLKSLDFVFENIQSERLGFCYDRGHENCFHPAVDCLSRYGDKLKMCRPIAYLSLEADFNREHVKSRIYVDLTALEYLEPAYRKARDLISI
jgi:L-ribulose-5-phosphate 3-epimerase